MDTKSQINKIMTEPAPVPQMQVRSDVRSGGDLETCLFNLDKWKERYYYWYEEARKQGKI